MRALRLLLAKDLRILSRSPLLLVALIAYPLVLSGLVATVLDRSTAYPLFGLRAGRVAEGLATRGRADIVYGVGASVLGYARAHRLRGGPRAPLVFNPQGLEEFGGFDGSYGGQRLKAVGYGPLRGAVRRTACSSLTRVELSFLHPRSLCRQGHR